ncbi:hypothetical protein H4217_007477 [Coemansia sp. RSA 1939]|nr:hypothetical protein H4217_007477 [Coemansia sp. RSA 1939]KAJ2599108.1 hypothetical protein EV177_007398 [Coemansia sp. RSA 1804]
MPCSYKIYIGLAKVTAASDTSHHTAGKNKNTNNSSFDLFSTPATASDHRFLAPFVDTPRAKHKRHTNKRQAQHQQHQHQHQQLTTLLKSVDYRFGQLQIEWWDSSRPTEPSTTTHSQSLPAPMDDNAGGTRQQRGPAVGVFDQSPDCTATVPLGVLRLYRCGKVHDTQRDGARGTSSAGEGTDGSAVLAVLAVPGYMTPTDFLSFTGSFGTTIEHVRAIRDDSPNHYMMVLRFRDRASATDFYAYFNGKTFSPLEPEVCHIVQVASVECETRELAGSDIDCAARTVCAAPAELFLDPPDPHDNDGSYEQLPTCPVCLERLDNSASGLLTTMCHHTFHCKCLARWGNGSCPVCRYTQTLPLVDHDLFRRTVASDGGRAMAFAMASTSGRTAAGASRSANPSSSLLESQSPPSSSDARPPDAADTSGSSSCHVCGLTSDLWICLICGTVGCGRYANAHAKEHFEHTQHPYSLELESQRVWDYVGDGYVHRILQNMADRKVIALDTYNASGGHRQDVDGVNGSAGAGAGDADTGDADSYGGGRWQQQSLSCGGQADGEAACSSNGEMRRLASSSAARGGPSAAAAAAATTARGSFIDAREKLHSVTQEYEALLTSQLESQRAHYEIQLARLQHQLQTNPHRTAAAVAKQEELNRRAAELEAQNHALQTRLDAHGASAAAASEEERRAWDSERKRLEAAAAKWLRKSTDDARLLADERELVRQLMDNQKALKEQIAGLNTGMRDLEEQVRDMSFFISTQQRIAAEEEKGESIAGASVVGVSQQQQQPEGKKGKSKAKRRPPPRK